MLIDARYEEDGTAMTLDQLLDECLILFVAGHETTANALSWAFYLLAKEPQHLPQIRRESIYWKDEEHPHFHHLPSLVYTLQVIEEALRLYPPAWIIDRVALADDEVNGFEIPKDTMVILYTYGTHHSKNLWNDPDKFLPRRFSPENQDKIRPYTYFPFGGGPRLCIGNNFALMEMQLVLSQLYHYFDFELISENINVLPLITLRPQEPLLFRIKAR